MFKKIVFGTVALFVSCSLAFAGESDLGLKVKTRLDFGVVTNAEATVEGDGFLEYGGISLRPVVVASYQFNEEWSAEFKFRGLFGFDDDDGEIFDDSDDAEVEYDELDLGGLVGYTFQVNDQLTITPVAGLSWRSTEIEGDADDFDGTGEVETDYMVLDLEARAAYEIDDKWAVAGEVMFGVPLTGESELEMDVDVPGVLVMDVEDEGDLDGGFLFSFGAEAQYTLKENILLTGGLAYELATIDWDYDDMDEKGETELGLLTLRFGAVFKF